MRFWFRLLGVSLLLAGCQRQKEPVAPEPPRDGAELHLGTNLTAVDADVVAWVNRHWLPGDISSVRPQNLALLDGVQVGQKELLFSDALLDQAESLIREAKSHGVTRISANLERQYTLEEHVALEQQIAALVHAQGLVFCFGPTLGQLLQGYGQFALHADIIAVQAQRWQMDADFGEKLRDLVSKTKAANPAMRVWVQLSTHPPGYGAIDADQLLTCVQQVPEGVDGVFLFHPPGVTGSWEIARAALERLRRGR